MRKTESTQHEKQNQHNTKNRINTTRKTESTLHKKQNQTKMPSGVLQIYQKENFRRVRLEKMALVMHCMPYVNPTVFALSPFALWGTPRMLERKMSTCQNGWYGTENKSATAVEALRCSASYCKLRGLKTWCRRIKQTMNLDHWIVRKYSSEMICSSELWIFSNSRIQKCGGLL